MPQYPAGLFRLHLQLNNHNHTHVFFMLCFQGIAMNTLAIQLVHPAAVMMKLQAATCCAAYLRWIIVVLTPAACAAVLLLVFAHVGPAWTTSSLASTVASSQVRGIFAPLHPFVWVGGDCSTLCSQGTIGRAHNVAQAAFEFSNLQTAPVPPGPLPCRLWYSLSR